MRVVLTVNYTNQIFPCFFFIIFSLQLVELNETLESEAMDFQEHHRTKSASSRQISIIRRIQSLLKFILLVLRKRFAIGIASPRIQSIWVQVRSIRKVSTKGN